MKDWILTAANGKSRILAGESLANLIQYLPGRSAVLITDTNVFDLYSHNFPDIAVLKIGTGEKIKTIETIEGLYSDFLRLQLDRSSFVVGIGGGIVCDITGYAAATFMRGLRFGFVPTTLLAQVDAAVGGKNGVNFLGYKNIVGLFKHPDWILIDPSFLKTLPRQELICGLVESIKHALIADPCLFDFLEQNIDRLLEADPDALHYTVEASVSIKADIVKKDALEEGERRKLNLGHTLGHALEKVHQIPHGRAVGIGLAAAARISYLRNRLSLAEMERIESLIKKLDIPTRLPMDSSRLLDALTKDKKKQGKEIHFALLTRIGNCEVEILSMEEVRKYVQDMCEHR